MAANIHPKFSISHTWALGENDWNTGMDANLKDFALFVQLIVEGITNPAPASPIEGETHIVGSSPSGSFATHNGEIAIYLAATWVFYTPIQGYTASNKTDDLIYYYSGTSWSSYAPSGSGDMLKSQYDSNDDGVVDSAAKVNGVDGAQNGQYYGKNSSGSIGFHNLPAVSIPDGTVVGHVPIWDGASYVPTVLATSNVRIAISAVGVLNDNETLASYSVVDSMTLPLNLAGSTAYAEIAPTADTTVIIKKNGTNIGTVDWLAGVKAATFTFNTATSCAAGNWISFVVPATADITMATVAITLMGNL